MKDLRESHNHTAKNSVAFVTVHPRLAVCDDLQKTVFD